MEDPSADEVPPFITEWLDSNNIVHLWPMLQSSGFYKQIFSFPSEKQMKSWDCADEEKEQLKVALGNFPPPSFSPNSNCHFVGRSRLNLTNGNRRSSSSSSDEEEDVFLQEAAKLEKTEINSSSSQIGRSRSPSKFFSTSLNSRQRKYSMSRRKTWAFPFHKKECRSYIIDISPFTLSSTKASSEHNSGDVFQSSQESDVNTVEDEEIDNEDFILKMKAVHDFSKRKPLELSFKKGDIIYVLEKNKTQWWKGRVKNQIGKFPVNYCKPVSEEDEAKLKKDIMSDSEEDEPTTKETLSEIENESESEEEIEESIYCIAMYSFTKKKLNQLSFEKGDKISVLEKHVSGWWKGELNGEIGKFPSNYCKVVTSNEGHSTRKSSTFKHHSTGFNGPIEPPFLIESGSSTFMIFSAPSNSNMSVWLKIFRAYRVRHIVSTAEIQYSKEALEQEGICLHEILFPEGGFPSEKDIENWKNLCSSVFQSSSKNTIGVHCNSGVESAPVLVAISLMEDGMKLKKATKLLREKKPESINETQFKKLKEFHHRAKKKKSVEKYTCFNFSFIP